MLSSRDSRQVRLLLVRDAPSGSLQWEQAVGVGCQVRPLRPPGSTPPTGPDCAGCTGRQAPARLSEAVCSGGCFPRYPAILGLSLDSRPTGFDKRFFLNSSSEHVKDSGLQSQEREDSLSHPPQQLSRLPPLPSRCGVCLPLGSRGRPPASTRSLLRRPATLPGPSAPAPVSTLAPAGPGSAMQ